MNDDHVVAAGCRSRRLLRRLGLRRRRIKTEWLRQLSVAYGAYNVANFAQNMKKDGVFFNVMRGPDAKRLGWRLSRTGTREAKAMLAELLAVA